jgi:hypothetical protein
MESILQENTIFVAVKKRPTEALFTAYKKVIYKKSCSGKLDQAQKKSWHK